MNHPFKVSRISPILVLLLLCHVATAQIKKYPPDKRDEEACTSCQELIENMPNEVLFGIHINEDGKVYFSISSREWFNKLFTNANDGVMVDLVTKSQYECSATIPAEGLPKGRFLGPVYRDYLKKNQQEDNNGSFSCQVGILPADLKKQMKQLEGNLVIVKNGNICYNTHFVDLDRSLWELLPMGLYTDTLISEKALADTTNLRPLLYTQKLQFTVPFAKSVATYNKNDLRPLYDSLHLRNFRIKKIEIRAYSSIEGAESVNQQLQQKRVRSMVEALQQYQSSNMRPSITTSENWVEFFRDIKGTPFESWGALTKAIIKLKLQSKTTADQLETVLSKHRKAIVTIYVDKNSGMETLSSSDLTVQFREALAENKLFKASQIQQEVFERVSDLSLPADYLDKLEVPQQKLYSVLLSDRETFKYALGLTDDWDALENFKTLYKLDSTSGRIRYNICALSFKLWQYDTAYLKPVDLLRSIHALPGYGIPLSLMKRMLINYYIVISEHAMYRSDYAAKDSAVLFIARNYAPLKLSDEELLTLAQYLSHYSHQELAEKMITTRVKSIDVSEDLLFYFVNLQLFHSNIDFRETYKTEFLNAISINRARFCRFFNSNNNDGASFQLLRKESLRSFYCEFCSGK